MLTCYYCYYNQFTDVRNVLTINRLDWSILIQTTSTPRHSILCETSIRERHVTTNASHIIVGTLPFLVPIGVPILQSGSNFHLKPDGIYAYGQQSHSHCFARWNVDARWTDAQLSEFAVVITNVGEYQDWSRFPPNCASNWMRVSVTRQT